MDTELEKRPSGGAYLGIMITMSPAVPAFFMPTLGDPQKVLTVVLIAASTLGLVSTFHLWKSPKVGFISKLATAYYALPILMTIAVVVRDFDVITHYYRRLFS